MRQKRDKLSAVAGCGHSVDFVVSPGFLTSSGGKASAGTFVALFSFVPSFLTSLLDYDASKVNDPKEHLPPQINEYQSCKKKISGMKMEEMTLLEADDQDFEPENIFQKKYK